MLNEVTDSAILCCVRIKGHDLANGGVHWSLVGAGQGHVLSRRYYWLVVILIQHMDVDLSHLGENCSYSEGVD